MIETALILLRNELINFLAGKDSASVVIDNIGMLETPTGASLTENIVLTLVNIEEESTLKNQSPQKRPFLKSAVYQNPPVYLNLYILFTCNYSGDHYQLALRRLSYIIQVRPKQEQFFFSFIGCCRDIGFESAGYSGS
jgi:hypothetical protein